MTAKFKVDISLLDITCSSAGFSISMFTVYCLNDYRSLLSIGVWFKELWELDICFYKFIRDI